MRFPIRKKNKMGLSFSNSPVLLMKLPKWRSKLIFLILLISFSFLILRAIYLQAVSKEFLQRQGKIRYERIVKIPAMRGKILDRNKNLMAASIPAKSIWVNPKTLEISSEEFFRLADLLNMKVSDLSKKLTSNKTFVYLKRKVDIQKADEILALNIPGIGSEKSYKRSYPKGEITAHLLGFTDINDRGQEGIELSQQSVLSGDFGSRQVIRDGQMRIVENKKYIKKPKNGRDLILSIDNKIQYIAFSALKEAVEKNNANAGGIVVLDVKTGEVLALANLPTFDPNLRQNLEWGNLRNRVMTDTFEPGSTIKPFAVSIAMEKGLITPNMKINTPKKIKIGSSIIGDSMDHEINMTVSEIIQQSSNVGMVKISQKLKPSQMWKIYDQVGFGKEPDIGFPGAASGIVRPFKSWKPIEQATISYGHGISVSLIQIARSYMIFARKGEIIPLSFLKINKKPKGKKVISSETAKKVIRMMELVVNNDGTAPQAQVRGYRVAGKTGTSQKNKFGKYVNKYVASFVGLIPASNPRIIIAVMIDEPKGKKYSGGSVAAPVFSKVAVSSLRSLDVPPDLDVAKTVITKKINLENM